MSGRLGRPAGAQGTGAPKDPFWHPAVSRPQYAGVHGPETLLRVGECPIDIGRWFFEAWLNERAGWNVYESGRSKGILRHRPLRRSGEEQRR